MKIDRTTWRSPNANDRKAKISYILLHYTGMKSAQDALQRLCDPTSEVSAHYLIDEGGTAFQLVEENKRAWHAGQSHWQGARDLNSLSVGIEIVNPGHEFGYRPFPAAQIMAVRDLCKDIMARYALPPRAVLAHSDIAPARKRDPGELFPWQKLAAEGVGVWPDDNFASRQECEAQDVYGLGYDPDCDLETVLAAFQRRFHPALFSQNPDLVGQADDETLRRIAALKPLLSNIL